MFRESQSDLDGGRRNPASTPSFYGPPSSDKHVDAHLAHKSYSAAAFYTGSETSEAELEGLSDEVTDNPDADVSEHRLGAGPAENTKDNMIVIADPPIIENLSSGPRSEATGVYPLPFKVPEHVSTVPETQPGPLKYHKIKQKLHEAISREARPHQKVHYQVMQGRDQRSKDSRRLQGTSYAHGQHVS